jgi:cytochrome c oxidase subunit II
MSSLSALVPFAAAQGERIPLFPPSASTVSGDVDGLYFLLIGVSVFFATLIWVLIFVFIVRYRRRPEWNRAVAIEGSLTLELLWTFIPLVVALTIFVWGARLFFHMTRVPAATMRIDVTGKQWMWKLQHPTGQREINELHVPAGAPIELRMISEDVIHSFFVPAFRIKRDVVPGRYATTWFEATRPGKYHLFCAEYCGAKHSSMIGTVHVLELVDYERWLSGAIGSESPRETGEKLFSSLRCDTCHNPSSGARGPDLAGLFGSTVQLEGGGAETVDADYVRRSVLDPTAQIVRGFQPLMPTYAGQVSEEQVLALVAYIESLGAPQAAKEEK